MAGVACGALSRSSSSGFVGVRSHTEQEFQSTVACSVGKRLASFKLFFFDLTGGCVVVRTFGTTTAGCVPSLRSFAVFGELR
jgi:hypothetical protein